MKVMNGVGFESLCLAHYYVMHGELFDFVSHYYDT